MVLFEVKTPALVTWPAFGLMVTPLCALMVTESLPTSFLRLGRTKFTVRKMRLVLTTLAWFAPYTLGCLLPPVGNYLILLILMFPSAPPLLTKWMEVRP